MDHYLGYHNAEAGGPFAHDGKFFTAKSFRPETLEGDRLWVIEGRGSPRQYRIVSTGRIAEVSIEKRPDEFRTSDKEDGLTIRFEVDEFNDPLDVTDFEWFKKLRAWQQNFSRGLTRLTDPDVVAELQAAWTARGTSQSNRLSADLDAIAADPTMGPTTKRRLIDARLGQGKFRQSLEVRWQGACAVTGCKILSALRASHIKPWRESSNEERLDPNNGLLLAAHVDAVFDAGLVSFRDDGRMLISEQISPSDRRALQLGGSLSKLLKPQEKKFLRTHREKKFVDNQ